MENPLHSHVAPKCIGPGLKRNCFSRTAHYRIQRGLFGRLGLDFRLKLFLPARAPIIRQEVMDGTRNKHRGARSTHYRLHFTSRYLDRILRYQVSVDLGGFWYPLGMEFFHTEPKRYLPPHLFLVAQSKNETGEKAATETLRVVNERVQLPPHKSSLTIAKGGSGGDIEARCAHSRSSLCER